MLKTKFSIFVLTAVFALHLNSLHAAEVEPGFVSVFDGKTFNGWKLVNQHGPGYGIKDGVLFCQRNGGGNLFTEKEYEDFIYRFEFRLESGSNNGIGLRSPWDGDSAYMGMECQVLDDTTKKYGPLKPVQMHGSIYGVIPSKVGFQKPVGEWNEEEITMRGRRVKVVLNGHAIVDANLNDVTDLEILQAHPDLRRTKGHIGFLGHTEFAEFRNIRIKELPVKHEDNKAADGFAVLFNGKNLKGWKGQVKNPAERAKMSPEELAAAQKEADKAVSEHWKAEDGTIVFDGKGKNLATVKDYGNFELFVDWKLPKDGDSGIYLRGCPQIQIWDPESKKGKNDHSVGSGGVHNNLKNPRVPTKRSDKPIGEWNRFHILMTGEKVSVWLNDDMVVHNVTMENPIEREKPLYPTGAIELQNHGDKLWFKNIFVREIPVSNR